MENRRICRAKEEQLAHYYARTLAIVVMLTKEVVDETDDQYRTTSTNGNRSCSEGFNITEDLESGDPTAFKGDLDRRELEVDYGCLTWIPIYSKNSSITHGIHLGGLAPKATRT